MSRRAESSRKGLNPKYTVNKNVYHSVKSPIPSHPRPKKKESYPDQFILLNQSINHRKFDFSTDTDSVSIQSCVSADFCYNLYTEVYQKATETMQEKFRRYFQKYPMQTNKKIVTNKRKKQDSKHVTIVLK